jgi:uncharacterized membrane protein YeaQ/YmgE (transglycosylase-associated protein family)
MSWIAMIVVGFIAGLIARAIMPGEQKMGLIMTAVLGMVGSVVANVLGSFTGFYKVGDSAGLIASVVGALVVLFIYGKVTAAKSAGPQA